MRLSKAMPEAFAVMRLSLSITSAAVSGAVGKSRELLSRPRERDLGDHRRGRPQPETRIGDLFTLRLSFSCCGVLLMTLTASRTTASGEQETDSDEKPILVLDSGGHTANIVRPCDLATRSP